MKSGLQEFLRNALLLFAAIVLLLLLRIWGSYLLFHVFAELFGIIVLISIFVVTWNTRQRLLNSSLTFTGLACPFIAFLSLLHTLAYPGMNVLPVGEGNNTAMQLWIAAMAVKAATLVIAPLLVDRPINAWRITALYTLATALLTLSIFRWDLFPAAFIPSEGPTPFKTVVDYIICAFFALAVFLWWRVRSAFSTKVHRLIVASLVFNVLAELMFTVFHTTEGTANLAGHLLMVVAYYLLYRAIVQTGLTDPFELLLKDLQSREEALKKTISDLEHARNVAEHASNAKGEFLAILSHELRTPLTPVLASVSDHLAGGDVPPHLQDTFHMIHRNIELQTRLVDDLLDLTRINRGKIRIDSQPIDVKSILYNTVRTQEPEFARKKLTLEYHPNASATWITGDAARIAQIVFNLLSNALKFTPAGGRVELRTTNEMKQNITWLKVEVIDNGVGIDPAACERIFEPFEQASPPTDSHSIGLGLGLAICRTMAGLHNGTVTASSLGKGKGATFTLSLPTIVKPEDQPLPLSFSPPVNAANLKILLVEDHPDTGRIISRLLIREGHQVDHVRDIASALERFANGKYDLVISDIGLPDGNGLEIIRRMRNISPATPSICMSGFGSESDQAASREAGATCHLVKPLTIQRLREAIEQATSSAGNKAV